MITVDVRQLVNSPERLEKLLKALDLPVDKLNPVELEKLREVLAESTDVFALDDSELGCTGLQHQYRRPPSCKTAALSHPCSV